MSTPAFYDKYFETLYRRLSLVCALSDEEKERIRINVMAKVKPIPLTVNNNYKDSFMETDTEQILNIYYGKSPNISGYGVLFNHKPNIPGRILEALISTRKIKKNEMFKHVDDVDKTLYLRLDVQQKVVKVLANAFYGAFGQRAFHFYNPYLGPSVTYTGQHVILSSILGFEAFLSGNFNFFNFDEVVKYIDNITSEEDLELTALDKRVDVAQVYAWLLEHCQFEMSESHGEVIGGILDNLPYSQLERLFTKNNLFFLLRNSTEVRDVFKSCYHLDFIDPDHPPEAVKDEVDALAQYLEYFVTYPYQWDNKSDVIATMRRRTVLISDTDSTFLNIDPAVRWFQEEFGVELDTVGKIVVCNIVVFNVTKFVDKVFYRLTTNMNVAEKHRAKVSMKSEFNFSRIILTKNKKQYAGNIVLQEGKLLKKPKIAVVGLSIKKIGTPKIARGVFNKILVEDMLTIKTIDPLVPFRKFLEFEKSINTSLRAGESKFLKPSKFTAEKAYKSPMTIQTVRGVRLWNLLYPDQFIPMFSSVNLLKLKKLDLSDLKILVSDEVYAGIEEFLKIEWQTTKPNKEGMMETITENMTKYGIDIISIPKDVTEFPRDLVPLIDVNNIINDNMKNGNILLESIGFKIIKSLKYETASNIIEI